MISKPLFQIEVLFVINIQHENFSHLFKNPAVFVDVLLSPRNSDDCRRFFVKAHRYVRSRQRPRIFYGGVHRNFVRIFRYDFPRRLVKGFDAVLSVLAVMMPFSFIILI